MYRFRIFDPNNTNNNFPLLWLDWIWWKVVIFQFFLVFSNKIPTTCINEWSFYNLLFFVISHMVEGIFLCTVPLKYPFLGCTSNLNCREPQPTCDTTSGRCHGCMEMGCTGHGFTCNQHTGKCVNKGLIWNTRFYYQRSFDGFYIISFNTNIQKWCWSGKYQAHCH